MSRLTLMFITNSPVQAAMALEAGADRVFVDLERIGKEERQGGLDTVKSKHAVSDVAAIRRHLPDADLLVRVNPLGPHSPSEIDDVIVAGANILMLPMFTSVQEVESFIDLVGGRAQVSLLLETPQALVRLPDYLRLSDQINEVHIGLNDLHLGMKLDFMFELLAGGIVDLAASQLKEHGVRFGFGGIARVGHGDIPAEDILVEHVRLGSEIVILSRAFHTNLSSGIGGSTTFAEEVAKLRQREAELRDLSQKQLDAKSREVRRRIFAFANSRRRT